MSKNVCSHCLQVIKDAHKENVTQLKARMLRSCADYVLESGNKNFKKRQISEHGGTHTEYANFQKLRYHGLIAHATVNGQRLRDVWTVTRRGWAFLYGREKIAKYVVTRDNRVIDHSQDLISLSDVWRDMPELETNFEYISESGESLGTRPNATEPTIEAPEPQDAVIRARWRGGHFVLPNNAVLDHDGVYEIAHTKLKFGSPIIVRYGSVAISYKNVDNFLKKWEVQA